MFSLRHKNKFNQRDVNSSVLDILHTLTMMVKKVEKDHSCKIDIQRVADQIAYVKKMTGL